MRVRACAIWIPQRHSWAREPELLGRPWARVRQWAEILRNAQEAKHLKLHWQWIWKLSECMLTGGIRNSIFRLQHITLRLWRERMAQRQLGLRMHATEYWARSCCWRERHGMPNKKGPRKSKNLTHGRSLLFSSREEIVTYRSRLRRRDGFSRGRWRVGGKAPRRDWWRKASRALTFWQAFRTPLCAKRNGNCGIWPTKMRFSKRIDSPRMLSVRRHPNGAR